MKKQISSYTFFLKKIIPAMVIVFLALVFAFITATSFNFDDSVALSTKTTFLVFILFLLSITGLFLFSLMKRMKLFDLIDQVYYERNSLVFINDSKEIKINLRKVRKIHHQPYSIPPKIVLTLYSISDFGSTLIFSPKGSLNPLRKNKDILGLIKDITKVNEIKPVIKSKPMSTVLSERATQFLATLERQSAVPTEVVEQTLLRQEIPAFEPWLDFHERYAGYIEPLGSDSALWGLMNDKPFCGLWDLTNMTEAEYSKPEKLWHIQCADVHPSYTFTMDQSGILTTDSTSNKVEVYIEQMAARVAFFEQSSKPPKVHHHVNDPDLITRVKAESMLVTEAVDNDYEYWLGEKIFAIYNKANESWVEILSY